MTEYELADLTTSVMSNYIATYSVFLTIVSAYVIAAFVAGSRLSRAQVAFVTLCFLSVTSVTILLCATMLSRALALSLQSPLEELAPIPLGSTAPVVVTFLLQGVIVAGSVWFMSRARNPRS